MPSNEMQELIQKSREIQEEKMRDLYARLEKSMPGVDVHSLPRSMPDHSRLRVYPTPYEYVEAKWYSNVERGNTELGWDLYWYKAGGGLNSTEHDRILLKPINGEYILALYQQFPGSLTARKFHSERGSEYKRRRSSPKVKFDKQGGAYVTVGRVRVALPANEGWY